MKSLQDFPYLSSRDFKLSNRLTDAQLQDLCTKIRGRMDNLVSDTPRVSVVFPAYNEEMYLPLMLWTLSKLNTTIPIEIIGVNNASTDRTGEIIEQSGIKRIDEPRKGVSYARQVGLENARGDIVATTDSDTHVPDTWIDASVDFFDKNPELVCFSGATYWQGVHISYILLQKAVRLLKGNKQKPLSRIWQFPGANTFYKKDIAKQIGGYELGSDLWEDIILANKLKGRGEVLRIENEPTIRVMTSARRSSSFNRTMHTCLDYILRNGKSGTIQSGQIFSDIR